MIVVSERAYTVKEAVAELDAQFDPAYRTYTTVSNRILNKAIKDGQLATIQIDGNTHITESAINMFVYWKERSIPTFLKISAPTAPRP
jgi:predicted transcriptional regulator